jgi:hypothetical protein
MQGGEKRYPQAPQEWQVHPIQMRMDHIESRRGVGAAVAIARSGGGGLVEAHAERLGLAGRWLQKPPVAKSVTSCHP